jgi:hypothetical protein
MRILVALLLTLFAAVGVHAQSAPVTFIFVKIQDQVSPLERGSKYEDPLHAALQAARLGEVTGGGTMMNKDKSIAWVGVDVDLYDVERGIPFLIAKLREFGVPPGTVLEYKVDGRQIAHPVH